MVSNDALDNAGVERSWSESSVSTSEDGGGGGGCDGVGASRSGRNAKLGFGRGGYGLVGGSVRVERVRENVEDIGLDEGELDIVGGKLGDRDGTGGKSTGEVGGGGFETELQGKLSSYNGSRAIGTPFRICECGRLAKGSGNCGAVGSDLWIAFSSNTSLYSRSGQHTTTHRRPSRYPYHK